jgi:hypothetical protein
MLLQRSAQTYFWSHRSTIYWYATYRFINGVSSVKKKNAKLEIAGGFFIWFSHSKNIVISTYWISLKNNLQKFIQRSLISTEIIEDSYDETADVLIYYKAESSIRSNTREYNVVQKQLKV